MSVEAVDAFFAKMAEDEALQDAYSSAVDRATRAAAVELAAEHGLEFTAEELGTAMESQMAELSDEQLDAVAGGLGTVAACCCCIYRDGSFMPALYGALQPAQRMGPETRLGGPRSKL
jgi:predicted ribosomally synthesized peptide with nif11-like leader